MDLRSESMEAGGRGLGCVRVQSNPSCRADGSYSSFPRSFCAWSLTCQSEQELFYYRRMRMRRGDGWHKWEKPLDKVSYFTIWLC